MGLRIIEDRDGDGAVLVDTCTGTAFGPVFEDAEECDLFLEWNGRRDVRLMSDSALAHAVSNFRVERPRWEKEKQEAEENEEL